MRIGDLKVTSRGSSAARPYPSGPSPECPRRSPPAHPRAPPAHRPRGAPGPWTTSSGPGEPSASKVIADELCWSRIGSPRGTKCAAQAARPKTWRQGASVPNADRHCPCYAQPAGSKTSPPPSSAAVAASSSARSQLQRRQLLRRQLAPIGLSAVSSRSCSAIWSARVQFLSVFASFSSGW